MQRRRPAFLMVLIMMGLLLPWTACVTVDEKGLVDRGHYHQAVGLCERKTGPERKDCFTLVSDAYLQKRDFDAAVRNRIEAGATLLFHDDFSDNRNGWSEKDSQKVFKAVRDGKFVFAHKREKTSWLAWPATDVPLETARDFSIESTFTKVDGQDTFRYGIIWGAADVENYYEFGITGDGNFRYAFSKENNWEAVTDWIKTDCVHRGNATNTLTVRKAGQWLRFFINGHRVLEKPFAEPFGNKVGFRLSGRMKVAFDTISVTRYPTVEETFRTVLEQRLADGDPAAFVDNCEKAGLTRNEAYVRIAETHFAKRDFEAAELALARAGWSRDKPDRALVFNELFRDNANQWFEKTVQTGSCRVDGGTYLFSSRKDKGGRFSWPKTVPSIDESGDFRIESTMTKIDGDDTSSYDLVWGMTDIDNRYAFGISGNGKFIYGRYRLGEWKTIADWTPSAHINRQNLTNTLAMEKAGDTLKLYINDRLVSEHPYKKFFGPKFGFAIYRHKTVAFDNLRIEQYPPQVARAMTSRQADNSRADAVASAADRMARRDPRPLESPPKR